MEQVCVFCLPPRIGADFFVHITVTMRGERSLYACICVVDPVNGPAGKEYVWIFGLFACTGAAVFVYHCDDEG